MAVRKLVAMASVGAGAIALVAACQAFSAQPDDVPPASEAGADTAMESGLVPVVEAGLLDSGTDGGACNGGPCAAVPLVALAMNPARLALTATDVFYTENVPNGNVMRVSKTTGEVPAVFAGAVTPFGIAISGDLLFVSSKGEPDTIRSFVHATTMIGPVLNTTAPTDIVADALGVVFIRSGIDVSRAARDLTSPGAEISSSTVTALAIDGTSVFVTTNGPLTQIGRADRGSGNLVLAGDSAGPLTAIAVDEHFVYSGRALDLVALDKSFALGTNPVTIHTFPHQVTAMVSDVTVTFIGTSDGSIWAVSSEALAGPRVVTLLGQIPACHPAALATDAKAIYIACTVSNAGSIWKLARP